ncbi:MULTISPECIES: AAA family ATPase [Gordonia]|uniref:AAA family ATPase n=2 Tax=Gordonia TaxID=2053 RepID=A0AAW6RAK4_GORRU|nr:MULTISPECIES: AAA family ATPase [Gordonia]MDG6781556.1 AAA family ATPase [Gordonia rubripertincta]NKY61428.1 AAA domain-containing protein [Gordonia rubripertincta]NKY61671.1 AAA domain-containing protein [Gordonia rubripertincta]GAA14270.1 5-methylcytosine-specific restriction enzyme B [Gordonia alkanivorans NBRC 16433]
MDPYGNPRVQPVYDTTSLWKARCLFGGNSLLFPDRAAWSLSNLAELDQVFNHQPLVGSGSFVDKLDEQLANSESDVRVTAAEVLWLYYLVPHTSVVGWSRKRSTIERILGENLPEGDVVEALRRGPWRPGQNYLQRPDLHVGYLIDFAHRAKQLDLDELEKITADPEKLTKFADSTDRSLGAARNMLLHFLIPTEYVSVAAGNHRRQLISTFSEFVADQGAHPDEQLRKVVRNLEEKGIIGPAGRVEFYSPPLLAVWRPTDDDNVGELEALRWKKNLCLYGPPGTGKSYTAKKIAESLIRREALVRWGAHTYFSNATTVDKIVGTNIHELQLHPGWDYSNFVVGLNLQDGKTTWKRGEIFTVLDKLKNQVLPVGCDPLPIVLILDEINRTDLSAMLGELFSLLERDKRGETRRLPSHGEQGIGEISLPADLYLIGTMNDIDQSVESLDFALRRRFLWRAVGFDKESLAEIVMHRWNAEHGNVSKVVSRTTYAELEEEITALGECASNLNAEISKIRGLGTEFEIGHTYFAEITEFLILWLGTLNKKPNSGTYLWTPKNEPRPSLRGLWNLSLRPLLEQYLASVEDRDQEMERLERAFLTRP